MRLAAPATMVEAVGINRVVSEKKGRDCTYLGGPEGGRVQHRTLRKLAYRLPRKLMRVSNLSPKLERHVTSNE